MTGLAFIIVLIVIGFFSGVVASAAGLASLVCYPGLIAVGLSPVAANVTGTFAMVFSGIGAVASSRGELRDHWGEALKVTPLTLAGCIVGALMLFTFPEKDFALIAPFFILLSAVLVLLPRRTNHLSGDHRSWQTVVAWCAIFFVGLYSGYFGAASGVLMLAILNVISGAPFKEYNAIKNLVMAFANLVSMVVYALKTTILWADIVPLAVGFLMGGYLGPKIVRRVQQGVMKSVVALGAIVLSGWLFYRAV